MSDDLNARAPDNQKQGTGEPLRPRQEDALSPPALEFAGANSEACADARIDARNREIDRLRAGYLGAMARKKNRHSAWRPWER